MPNRNLEFNMVKVVRAEDGRIVKWVERTPSEAEHEFDFYSDGSGDDVVYDVFGTVKSRSQGYDHREALHWRMN